MKRITALMLIAVCGTRMASAQDRPSREEILRRIDALQAELQALRAVVAEEPVTPTTQAKPVADDLQVAIGLDTYYDYNFNKPIGRINLLRAYDVTSNNFSLNQVSAIVEKRTDVTNGHRIGGRLDLQYGQATETLQGSLVNEPRPWVYRNVFQAYGTYVAPLGSGLTVDFGKWASALGYENNYTKDQINYSRSYWFNFLPFYHMGARLQYRPTDAVSLNYWITNGTQQTEAFNNFKDQYIGTTVQPAKTVSWTIGYYLGQEHPDVHTEVTPAPSGVPTQPGLSVSLVQPYFTGKLQILDTYATWSPSAHATVGVEADYVTNANVGAAASRVWGGAAYLRRQLTAGTAIGGRAELLSDTDALFSGTSQTLKEATVTYDYRVAEGFLLRGEWRHDWSTVPFFLTATPGVLSNAQSTATLGMVWWWGTKTGAW